MTATFTYDVERRALPDHEHRVFNTRREVEDFLFDVADRHTIPLELVEWIPARSTCAYASAVTGIVTLPDDQFGRSIITILHELAHVAAPKDAGHTTEWLYWFTYLLRHEVSITAEASLRLELGLPAIAV